MDDNLQVVVAPLPAPDPNQFYSFQQSRPQHFSISYSIIKYMIKNPQLPKAWKKLIKTCKYFYSKNRIYPVSGIMVSDKNFGANGIAKDPKGNDGFVLNGIAKDPSDRDGVLINPVVYNPNGTRLWACGSLSLESLNDSSVLFTKLDKFDLYSLNIADCNLTWNEYQKLTASKSILRFDLIYCDIFNNVDGTIITIDKYLENLENIEDFTIHCANNSLLFKSDTIKNMIDRITTFKNIYGIGLLDIPENFDIIAFKPFLMTNTTIEISLYYTTRNLAFRQSKNLIKQIKKNPSLIVPNIYLTSF